jgi:hypothetical protein
MNTNPANHQVSIATLKTQGSLDAPIVLKDDESYEIPPNAQYAFYIQQRFNQSRAENPITNMEDLMIKEFLLMKRGQLGFGEPY